MGNNIAGKVVVITGASSGLGEAAARFLSAEGASVALGARRCERRETKTFVPRFGFREKPNRSTERHRQEFRDVAMALRSRLSLCEAQNKYGL